jgi:hypothetical protein
MMYGCIIFLKRLGLKLRYQIRIFLMEDFVIQLVSMVIKFMFMEVSLINTGMKNAESTLDNLAILCLDGKNDDFDEGIERLI